jgi:hypothetical protein
MKQHYIPDSKTSFTLSRPIGLDSETWKSIEPIFEALQEAQRHKGRFRFYGYLAAVYQTYKEWRDLRISKEMARHISQHFKTPRKKGTSPVRTLIEITFPALDPKQKSRWSRALEFAASKKIAADKLPRLFKKYSGIAGCPRFAAEQKPKRDTYRNDWI